MLASSTRLTFPPQWARLPAAVAVAAAMVAAAAHAQPAQPAPPAVPGPSAVQPAPAMTPGGRVTPGGVRNAHRQEQLAAQAAGDAGATVVPGTGLPGPLPEPAPPSMWTAAQAREAFRFADRDADGTLTRAEAQRLPVLPRTFEDLDANKDGLLDVNEYLAGFQR